MREFIGIAIALVIGIGIGYYEKPSKIETVTGEAIKKEAERDKRTTITEVKRANGGSTRVTVIDSHIETKHDSERNSVTTVTNTIGVGVRLLVPMQLIQPSIGKPPPSNIGLSIDYRILGPVTLGAFGFTNGPVGLSIGIAF
jgi:hypothetical protein